VRPPPPTRSILWTDPLCYQLTTLAPAVLLLALLVKLTGSVPGRRGGPDQPVDPATATWVLVGGIAVVLILSALVALRIARVRRLFDAGVEVEATVRKVSRFRGGSTLRLEFRHRGETRRARAAFQRWSRSPVFEEGMRLSLLVDPDHPRRVVPVAFYERT